MEITKDKLVFGLAMFLIVLFASVMAYELSTSYANIKSCDNIDTTGEIDIVFYPNVTLSEAYSLINSTGGKNIEHGYYYIGNVSDGKSLDFVIKVDQGEEDHYIEIYKENPEVYDAYKHKVVC